MQRHADVIYGSDEEYYKKYPRKKPIKIKYIDESLTGSDVYEFNTNYKPIHDTYRKILIDANNYAGKADIDGYKPYFTNTNTDTGFYGRAYINPKNKTVVIAFKGADIRSYKDWYKNNYQMWRNKEMPTQFKDAEQFYFDVRERLIRDGKNYKINIIGYSLGGTLAQLLGAKYGNETVTFNAFGTGQMQDSVVNYTDNIINYGHINDFAFNMENTKQIGKNVYTKGLGVKNSKQSIHEMESMGDLQFRIKNCL